LNYWKVDYFWQVSGALCVHVACSSQANGGKAKILFIYSSIAFLAGVLILLGQYLVAVSQNKVTTGSLPAATVRVPLSSLIQS
jgi:hypothetical protein